MPFRRTRSGTRTPRARTDADALAIVREGFRRIPGLAGGRGISDFPSEEVELVARGEIEQADIERLLELA
jgi:hypothetical protein